MQNNKLPTVIWNQRTRENVLESSSVRYDGQCFQRISQKHRLCNIYVFGTSLVKKTMYDRNVSKHFVTQYKSLKPDPC